MVDSPQSSINLQLGDIIEIFSPDDDIINNKQFLIDYIDNEKIKLINIENSSINILRINNGNFENSEIQSISLLSRADSPSYAIQNNLIPNNWINVYFNSEIPFIITGQITNLEEDMIEINTTNDDVIYIDFEYKGIPESLPITKIEIRSQPTQIQDQTTEVPTTDVQTRQDKSAEQLENIQESEESEQRETVEIDNSYLKQILINADEINFGEELGEITQIVDIDDSQRRFSLEQQTNDLLMILTNQIYQM